MFEIFDINEQSHRKKADYWLAQGRLDYARGSLRKAHKWQQKRREFEASVYGQYPKTALGDLIDEKFRRLEKQYSEAFIKAFYGE